MRPAVSCGGPALANPRNYSHNNLRQPMAFRAGKKLDQATMPSSSMKHTKTIVRRASGAASCLTRRAFVQSAAAGIGALGLPTPLFPDDANAGVIDAHTHFYDPTRPQGVPWPNKSDALLYCPVLRGAVGHPKTRGEER